MVGNIIDYLEWYGRFGFDALAFNEVDNLILSELSYAPLEGIVPAPGSGPSVTAAEAAALLKESGIIGNCCRLEQNAGNILYAMAKSRRFAEAGLSNYVNKHDFEQQEQFAALHVELTDGTVFVAYAGTDDTLLGWKEDLNMAYRMPVPSQQEAVEYLEESLRADDRPIRIGGHSKGGNLAVYAAVMCDWSLQDRIEAIYNNDGPGFLDSMLEKAPYRRIEERIHTLVPETSIIGMLLEHCENYEVVKSGGRGIMQHDGLNWQVYQDGFVKLDARSKESLLIDKTISTWIRSLDDMQRMEFVDAVYNLLTKVGITRLSDFEHYNLSVFNVLIEEMFGMDSRMSKMMHQVIRALVMEYRRNVVQGVRIAAVQARRKESV